MAAPEAETLTAPYRLEYTYRRATGPVIGQFLGALKVRRALGAQTATGRVIVPPTEYDPDSGEPTCGLVDVADHGVVTTWAWVGQPRPTDPLDRPFAWALIRLDGADSAMLHALDAGEIGRVRTGMRVQARWAEVREGAIKDIACFEPEEAP